jgi:uncharacterized protein
MSKDKLKWLKMRRKTDPEYPYEPPIWLGPLSNGEFYKPQTALDRKIRDEIRRRCDDNARKLGMDRREFMASAMGMVTSLSVLNMAAGCGDANGRLPSNIVNNMAAGRAAGGAGMTPTGSNPITAAGGSPASPSGGSPSTGGTNGSGVPVGGAPGPGVGDAGMTGTPDGGYACSKDAMMNPEMARALVGGDYFIMDMQTHHVGPAAGNTNPVGANGCANTVMNCTTPDNYIRAMFEMSETTVAVLSGVPGALTGSNDIMGIISNSDMQTSRDRVNNAAMPGAERMIAHAQVMVATDAARFGDLMTKALQAGTIGWKCYPPAEPTGNPGWFLHEVGAPFIQKAIDLHPMRKTMKQERPIICVHKGFPFSGWSQVHADPMPDVGKAALMFQDVNFVIYHSAFSTGNTEGPFTYDKAAPPDALNGGTDRLWWVITDNDLKGKNVYAEMGSAWKIVMTDPMAAQHYVGKALKHMGTDRVVWGSETTWFGCPQDQIDAFKMLVISKEYQEEYGYPELTEDVKRQVFGGTGAGLYGIDPCATRYEVSLDMVAMRRNELDDEFGPRRWALTNKPAIKSRRDFIELCRDRDARGEIV